MDWEIELYGQVDEELELAKERLKEAKNYGLQKI